MSWNDEVIHLGQQYLREEKHGSKLEVPKLVDYLQQAYDAGAAAERSYWLRTETGQ